VNRTMYDSSNPLAIPAGAGMVAGYVPPSRYAWTTADWQRFAIPESQKVRITVAGAEPDARAASVIDIETGAFSPAQVRNYVRERNAFRPGTATAYVNRSNVQAVVSAAAGLRLWIWLANPIGTVPTPEQVATFEGYLPEGMRLAAWQYAWLEDYDVSLVIADDWHRAPSPADAT
jgi:hypothetical protein